MLELKCTHIQIVFVKYKYKYRYKYKNVGLQNIRCKIFDFLKFNRRPGFTAALMEGITENRKVHLPKITKNRKVHLPKKKQKTRQARTGATPQKIKKITGLKP